MATSNSELFTISQSDAGNLPATVLYIDFLSSHDGIIVSLVSTVRRLYKLYVHFDPEELDAFIASKIPFWAKNSLKIIIGYELGNYSKLSRTRRLLTKRMLRDDLIIKIHSDL